MAYYQQNSLSIKSRQLLANLLAELVMLSENIETYRIALASQPGFDTIGLFRLLDHDGKGYLREKDIFRMIGTTHRKLVTYAFSWLDQLKLGEVSRLQFAAFLLPKDDTQLREIVVRRMEQPELQDFQDVNAQSVIFVDMLLGMISREMRLIQMRRELTESEDYTAKAALYSIDQNAHDWVCTEDVLKFMKNYGVDCSLRQGERIVETINFRLNGKVTQKELTWMIEGLEKKNEYLEKVKQANKLEIPSTEQQAKNRATSAKETSNRAGQSIIKEYQRLMAQLQAVENEEQSLQKKLTETEKDIISSINEQEQNQRDRLRKQKDLKSQNRLDHHRRNVERQLEIQRLLGRTTMLEMASQRAETNEKGTYAAADYTHPVAESIRRKYANLNNLNNLAVVESQRKSLQSSSISTHLKNSDWNLTESKQVRDQIRREKEGLRLFPPSSSKIGTFVSPIKRDPARNKPNTISTNKMWS